MVKTPVSICFYRKKITARKERSGLQGHRCLSLGERIVRKKSEPFVAQGHQVFHQWMPAMLRMFHHSLTIDFFLSFLFGQYKNQLSHNNATLLAFKVVVEVILGNR